MKVTHDTENFSFTVHPMREPASDEFAQGYARESDECASDLVCICENTASDGGFIYCSRDARQFEPGPGEWDDLDIDGFTVACLSCWRVIDVRPARDHAWTPSERTYWEASRYSEDLDDPTTVAVRVIGTVSNPALPDRHAGGETNRLLLTVAYELSSRGLDPLWIDHGHSHQVVVIPSFFADGSSLDLDPSEFSDERIAMSKVDYVNDDGSDGPLDPSAAHLDSQRHDFGDGRWDSVVVPFVTPYSVADAVMTAHAEGALPQVASA